MKKLLIALFISVAALASAEIWEVSVSTTDTLIVPQWTQSGIAWSAQTYAAGSTVLDNGRVYWAPNGGSSTVAPSTGSDGVEWIKLPKKPWKNIWISGDLSQAVNINVNGEAVSGKGYVLDGARSRVHMPDNFSGTVRAIAQSGTATIEVTAF